MFILVLVENMRIFIVSINSNNNYMIRIILFAIYCILFSITGYCQSRITEEYLQSFKKKKFAKFVIGNKSVGTAYFYPKKTQTVFSIIDRKKYGVTERSDSLTNIAYFFRNDSLIKASISRYYRSKGNRPISEITIHLYFKEGVIVDKAGNLEVWIPETSVIIKEAMDLLANSKVLFSYKQY